MHRHRLCLGRNARLDKSGDVAQQAAKPQGWKPDEVPLGWNKKWRRSSTYHVCKKVRRQLRRRTV